MGNVATGRGVEFPDGQPVPHEVAMRILQHCEDWRDRKELLLLTPSWAFDIARDPQTWHFMCERLEIEHGTYIPPLRRDRRQDWKDIFTRMLAWQRAQSGGEETSFAIKVVVRFRPLAPASPSAIPKEKRACVLRQLLERKEESLRANRAAGGEEAAALVPTIEAEVQHLKHELRQLESSRLVSLPLHQRLQLIRAEHGCSTRQARKILAKIMRGGQESDHWAGAVLPEDGPQGSAAAAAPPVIGSAAHTAAVRSSLLDQHALSSPQRAALQELSTAGTTPATFIDQEVGRWLGAARSPRRTVLATARTELGVLRDLKVQLDEQSEPPAPAPEPEAKATAADDDEDEAAAEAEEAEMEWQASEERRRAAVSEARAEILRLEQVELLSETARVRDEIAALQRELGLEVTQPSAEQQAEALAAVMESTPAPAEPPTAAAAGPQAGVVSNTDREVWVADPVKGIRSFELDRVLDGTATQEQVYGHAAADAVTDLLNGTNGCVFAYGQTGSGKSHTMFGSGAADLQLSGGAAEGEAATVRGGAGLVPRCCAQLLEGLRRRRQLLGGWEATLKVAYVQVFGDEVTDLLAETEEPQVLTLTAGETVRSGALDHDVDSAEQMSALLQRAEAGKRRAATLMNEHSSRAHSLLFLRLEQSSPPRAGTAAVGQDERTVQRSQLCLADLGGSEQVKKSGVAGERLQEAVNINLGLLALKNVIGHLHRGDAYVPYSDNRLTELLRDALGGRSKTVVVVAARLEPPNAAETLHALRFGERCRQVSETVGGSTMSTAVGLIEALTARIAECEAAIEAKERWETRTETTMQETTNPFTGEVETTEQRKAVSELVGAEAERVELERLLAQRAALLGK